MSKIYLALVVASLLATSAVKASDAPSPGVDLSGTWVLNTELSDDPKEVMKERMQSMRAHGGPGGRGSRPGGPPPGGGFGGSEQDHEKMRQRVREFEPARRIVIVSGDQHVTMIPEGRDSLTVIPDGTPRERKTPLGVVTMEAEWKDMTLEVKTKGQYGREAKQLYRINADGRLEVVMEIPMPGGGDATQIVMRYDEAGGETEQ
jgi:hypothetical protein